MKNILFLVLLIGCVVPPQEESCEESHCRLVPCAPIDFPCSSQYLLECGLSLPPSSDCAPIQADYSCEGAEGSVYQANGPLYCCP